MNGAETYIRWLTARDVQSPSTRNLVRGVGLAVWSWIAVAALLAQFSGQRAVEAVLGPGGTSAQAAAIRDQVPGAGETFVSVLTLQFGQSWVLSPGTPVGQLVWPRAGTTLTFAVLAVVLTAVVAGPLAALARGRPDGPLAVALSAIGAVPALGWLLLLVAGMYAGLYDLSLPADGAGLLLPALTLALPAGVGLARVAAREPATTREWAVDGWLYALWGTVAVLAVEQGIGAGGLGTLWVQSFGQGDWPVFVATSAVLALPVVVASVVRELAWDAGDDGAATTTSATTAADGGAVTVDSALDVVTGDRRVLAGTVLFGGTAVVGLVGSLATNPSPGTDPSTVGVPQVLDALGALVTVALLALVVAASLGFGLGLLARRGWREATAVRVVADPLGTLPVGVTLVALLVLVGAASGNTSPATLGVLLGLVAVPLVARAVEHADGATVLDAARPGVGVAATATAVLALVTVELAFLRLAPPALSGVVGVTSAPASALVATLVVVVPVAFGLRLAGEGLRS